MPTRRSLRSRNSLTSPPSNPTTTPSSRPRRTSQKQVTIARDPSTSPEGGKKALNLTVKMPSSKLREATSGSVKKGQSVAERERLEPAEIVSGPRGSRAKKSYIVDSDSDENDDGDGGDVDVDVDEEEEDEEEDVPIEDQIGEPEQSDDDDEEEVEATSLADADEEQEEPLDEDDEDAEGDADEDIEMDDESPMPPPPTTKKTASAAKPSVTVTPARPSKAKSVEAKETKLEEDEDDDEELSSIDSDGGSADAEGEEDISMDADSTMGDIQSSPGMDSRGSTPDVSKMTKRQRSRLDQVMGSDDFLQLPMEPQQKKVLTAEEHAMRRAEMARRRKNLSEKRNEEEKMDTINRLLKKQAPKRRGKISAAEIAAAGDDAIITGIDADDQDRDREGDVERANCVYARWVSDAGGCRLGVPGEWLGGPVGGWMRGGGGGKGWMRGDGGGKGWMRGDGGGGGAKRRRMVAEVEG